jgi:RNA polymerase sigma-70 factor, ECF subfamily
VMKPLAAPPLAAPGESCSLSGPPSRSMPASGSAKRPPRRVRGRSDLARPPGSVRRERRLLAQARAGDEGAFRRLVEPHRADLLAHCRRMLRSPHDAEDALQDTLLRAWRALPGFGGRSLLRSWLYRIATNVCLDAIARRRRRVLPGDFGAATTPGDDEPLRAVSQALSVEPYLDTWAGNADDDAAPEARYERREGLELAVIAALQDLPRRQRAALILRDVLGFSAKEAAHSLQTTVPSVNGALVRARRRVEKRPPERHRQATLRTLGDWRLRKVAERLADALERGEIDAILALLAADATFAGVNHRRRSLCGYLRTTDSSLA